LISFIFERRDFTAQYTANEGFKIAKGLLLPVTGQEQTFLAGRAKAVRSSPAPNRQS
jgi:hypothetical protein